MLIIRYSQSSVMRRAADILLLYSQRRERGSSVCGTVVIEFVKGDETAPGSNDGDKYLCMLSDAMYML